MAINLKPPKSLSGWMQQAKVPGLITKAKPLSLPKHLKTVTIGNEAISTRQQKDSYKRMLKPRSLSEKWVVAIGSDNTVAQPCLIATTLMHMAVKQGVPVMWEYLTPHGYSKVLKIHREDPTYLQGAVVVLSNLRANSSAQLVDNASLHYNMLAGVANLVVVTTGASTVHVTDMASIEATDYMYLQGFNPNYNQLEYHHKEDSDKEQSTGGTKAVKRPSLSRVPSNKIHKF